jgi:hypothetical protein
MRRQLTLMFADSYEELTPAELATLLSHAPNVSKLLDGAKAYAEALLKSGKDVPGWELKPGRNNRVWLSDEAAKTALAAQGINDPYEPPQLLSVAQAEKKVADPDALKPSWKNVPGKPTLKQKTGAAALAETSKPNFGF